MKYVIASLSLSAICYYFQIMWMAWIFLILAAFALMLEAACLAFAVHFANKIIGGRKNGKDC